MYTFWTFVALALCFRAAQCTTIDDDFIKKNINGVTEFQILNRNIFKIPNRFRANQPAIKFSLNGAFVESVNERNGSAWSFHLTDSSTVEISVKEAQKEVEYYLIWHGRPNVDREVCFHYALNAASWYQTYQSDFQEWPMDTARELPKTQFNSLLAADFPRVGEFSFILEQLFVNTDGFAVLPDEHQPLFFRRDPNHGDPLLCFSVNNTVPYDTGNHNANYLDLKLRLFSASTIQTVTDFVVNKSGHIPKPTEIPDENKFIYPISFGKFNQVDLLKYVDDLQKNGIEHAELLQHGDWATTRANLWFDKTRFPDPDSMIAQIQSKGYRLTLELYPEAIADHNNTQKYMVKQADGKISKFVDFTNAEAANWYFSEIETLYYDRRIQSYLAYSPSITNFKLSKPEYPNVYYKRFTETVYNATKRNTTSFLGYKTQHLPVFLQLITHDAGAYEDKVLSMKLKNALALSIGGYSFIALDRIYEIKIANHSARGIELTTRWIQLASLMPNISIDMWPSKAEIWQMLKKFIHLHLDHAKIIIELARRRITDGTPIIRPIWYVAPDEPKTYHIDDQFMLGNDILVAPVLVIGQRERNVYFPPGTWLDQHGKVYQGPGDFKVSAPLDELPYFKRKQ